MCGAERRCLRRAESQNGLIAEWQAIDEGMSPDQIFRRVESGRWRRVHQRVYAIGGFPTTWIQRVAAAVLWAEGPASHRTAGCLWGLSGLTEGPVEVITQRKLRNTEVILHRRTRIPEWTLLKSGILVTDPTETLLDLASVAPLPRLETATDSALRRRLTYLELLSERLERRAIQGRNGVRTMRAIIAARDVNFGITQSDLESMFLRLVKRYNLPSPVPQHVLHDHNGAFLARPDFAYPEARLAIELQSYEHHSGRQEWEKDQARFGDFAVIDWTLIAVTYLQMKLEPGRTADRVRRILWSRSRAYRG